MSRRGVTTRAPCLRHQPALDGLRGIAVAAVLLYHGNVTWLPGGYLGVDAFFVLSGYLITSLLLVEWHGTETIDLRRFWARRARRLLPALFGLVAGVLIYASLFAPADQLAQLRGDVTGTLLYVANWRAVFSGHAYMDQFASPSPLMHTWSLAVEEQWYLLWPVVAVVTLRRTGLKGLTAVAIAGLVGSVWWAHVESHARFARAYFGTDTRAASLLVGAVLAIVLFERGQVRSRTARAVIQAFGVVGVVVVGWCWATVHTNDARLFDGFLLAAALGVGAVVVAVVQPGRGMLARVLSFAPLRGLGIVSYGVYLWHWPVFLVLDRSRTGVSGAWLLVVRCAASVSVALASYVLIERPIRAGPPAHRHRSPRRLAVRLAAVPVVAGGVAVATVLATSGAATAPSLEVVAARVHRQRPALPVREPLPRGTAASSRVAEAPVRVLFVGDSTALMVGAGFALPSVTGLWIDDQAMLGCGLLRGGTLHGNDGWTTQPRPCDRALQDWRAAATRDRSEVVVLLVGPWDIQDRRVGGRYLSPGSDAYASAVRSALDDAVTNLSCGGARVVILTSPHLHPRNTALRDANPDPRRIDVLNALEREYAATHPATTALVDYGPWLDAQEAAGRRLRPDGVHLGLFTARVAADWLTPRLRALRPRPTRPSTPAPEQASVARRA